jgi:hypothetical protein
LKLKIERPIRMKHLFLITGLLLPAAAQAATISQTFSMSTTSLIPDGDLNGLVQTISPSTLITGIDVVTLTLNTNGGWNGDLYAYLWHDGVISVLLNRTGRTSALPEGTPTSGMSVTFEDVATTDIHAAAGGFGSSVTGSFQPSGRDISPLTALDTSPRTASLSSFNGLQASGDWRLFIADASIGDQAAITSWSVTITGTPIPEPSVTLLGGLAFLGLLARRRRLAA